MNTKPAFHAGDHSAQKEECCIELAPVSSRCTPAGTPIELADIIIRELIAIGFTLASCVDIADDKAVTGMGRAVTDLDRVIRFYLDTGRDQLTSYWPAKAGSGGWPP
jgi:hypothetical protein